MQQLSDSGPEQVLITMWPIAKAIFSLFCLTLIVFLSFLCLYQGILKFEWLQNRAAKFMESYLATMTTVEAKI